MVEMVEKKKDIMLWCYSTSGEIESSSKSSQSSSSKSSQLSARKNSRPYTESIGSGWVNYKRNIRECTLQSNCEHGHTSFKWESTVAVTLLPTNPFFFFRGKKNLCHLPTKRAQADSFSPGKRVGRMYRTVTLTTWKWSNHSRPVQRITGCWH